MMAKALWIFVRIKWVKIAYLSISTRTGRHQKPGVSTPPLPEATVRSAQDGRMGPPIFDYNAP